MGAELFAAAGAETVAAQPSLVEEMLAGLNADALTPRDALELIYRLKAAFAENEVLRSGALRADARPLIVEPESSGA